MTGNFDSIELHIYHKILGLSVPQLPFEVILYAANLTQFKKMKQLKLLILN